MESFSFSKSSATFPKMVFESTSSMSPGTDAETVAAKSKRSESERIFMFFMVWFIV
uniref:Uncharacterized protein n=1 Tax=Arabidopsis thaliana TaxID=3702 RepID=Q8GZ02_ARATH|nr:unknown protein [Arabidopsis thaliana]